MTDALSLSFRQRVRDILAHVDYTTDNVDVVGIVFEQVRPGVKFYILIFFVTEYQG